MDFSIISKLKNKEIWWMDVVMYFVVSLLIATLFSYGLFVLKNVMQSKEIDEINLKMLEVGTEEQKGFEKEVVSYQKKIADFLDIFANHRLASNAFAFLENHTRPNIWFDNFSLDRKAASVQLSGEAENMEALSRQVAVFENNVYIKDLSTFSSSLADEARAKFSINLMLDPKIFEYIAPEEPEEEELPPEEPPDDDIIPPEAP